MPTNITIETRQSPSSASSFTDTEPSDQEAWEHVSTSDLDPSDSASHPPTSRQNSRQRESSARRRSSQEHRRPTRVHRHPTPIDPSNVDSLEYEQGYGRGYGPPPGSYGARAPPPGYAPSFASAFPPNPYPGNSQMIPFGAPGGYPYPQNPMSNPFSPVNSSGGGNYFHQPHHPGHGGGYPGNEIMPYGQNHHGYPYGPGFQGPSPPATYFPPYTIIQQPAPEPRSSPPAKSATPAPPAGPAPPDPAIEIEKQKAIEHERQKAEMERQKAEMEKHMAEKEYANLQKVLAEQKAEADKWKQIIADREEAEKKAAEEAERNARHAADTKQQVDAAMSEAQKWKKMVTEREAAEKKAAEEAATRAENERKKQEAVDAAMAEAMKWRKIVEDREAAEAKAAKEAEAKADLDKKLKEAVDAATKKALLDKEDKDRKAAEKAAADAKAQAEKDAANAPPPPPPAPEKKKPIKFKDAVGRKFSFPFHLCSTWQGMEDLIKQAFLHVEVIGPHVAEGHYDLIGPNGEIILPQVWETMIEPDLSITMHMWPMPEPPKPPVVPDIIGVGPDSRRPGGGHLPGGPGGKRPPPPPHPNIRPGGGPVGPPPGPPGFIGNPGIIPIKDPNRKKKTQSSGFFGLGFSKPASKPSGKGAKKSSSSKKVYIL